VQVTGGGGASVTISDTAPSSPNVGDLWWSSTLLTMFVYYNDGTSSQWVVASPGISASSPLVNAPFSVANVAASGATALNWTNGDIQKVTLNANSTIAVSGWPASGTLAKLTLDIQNTGAFNITGWPTGTKWAGGAAPTITSGAGKQDVIVLMSLDGGTTVLGSVAGQNYS
jgi:hypothetical protein